MSDSPKILIAEDEEMLLESLVFFLSDEGYHVTEAKDGQQTNNDNAAK